MIVGKDSWKGLLLLVYVALTICAAIGCFLAEGPFFTITGIALMISNCYIAYLFYREMSESE